MQTIFTGARVFDGHRFLDGPHDVTVADGRFLSVEPARADHPTDATLVDSAGATLTPGFIDCHVHMMLNEVSALEQAVKHYSLPYYESTVNARVALASGITSARDAGGTDAGMKAAIEQGLIAGPRLKIAVGMMSITGGHGDFLTHAGIELPPVRRTPAMPVAVGDGPDEVRRIAREMFRAGADHIKICSTGGVLSPSDDPSHSHFSTAELTVIVEEAEAHGSYVMAHAIGAEGIKNALRAGIRSIEHGFFADDEVIQLMLEKEAYFVPTLSALGAVFEMAKHKHIPAPMLEKAARVIEVQLVNFARVADAGVRIAMGSDVGVGPHGTGLRELPLMGANGLGLEGALAAATSTAADLIRETGEVGVIAPGARADLVAVDFPITTVDDLSMIPGHIQSVWQDGRCMSNGPAALTV